MATNNSLFVSMPLEEFQQLLKDLIKDELKDFNKDVKIQDDDLMSIEEVKTFLHVSKPTIHAWKKKKLIRSYRIGRRIFFKKHELLDCMKKTKSNTTEIRPPKIFHT